MDSIREKIVTPASLRRPEGQSEAAEALPEAQTPESLLKQAQYDQIMRRLQQAADEAESDVMITVQDREVCSHRARSRSNRRRAGRWRPAARRSSSVPG